MFQRAVLIHHEDGVELYRLSDDRRAAAEPASAVEVSEVAHGEGVPDVVAQGGDVFRRFVQVRAAVALFHSVVGEQPLAR